MKIYVQFEKCGNCGSQQVVKLPADWQGDKTIPIVACGNPFHYTERSINDSEHPHLAEQAST